MKAIAGIRDNRGYTIVEMMIAAGIVMFVLAGVYGVYVTMHQSNQTSKATLEMQQNVRVTMDDITRLLTMSGYQGNCKETHAHGIVYKRDPADNINYPPKSDVISDAHSVGFTYWDSAYSPPAGCKPERRMRIYLDSGNHQVLCEQETFYNSGGTKGFKLYPETPVVLSRNVDNLTFRYYDKVGNEISPADLVTQSTVVRKVTVTVTGRTSLKDLVAGDVKLSDYKFSLTSQVSPANLGLEGHSVDAIPPAVPTGLALTDLKACGRVKASWNANSEVDLDHYTLYYGSEAGVYDHKVDVSKGSTNCTITGLPNGAAVYVSISATDASGNSSDKSSEVSLTPQADKPSVAPVNFRASAGSSDGQILLQWDKHPDPDVTYYYIYRKEIPDPEHVSPFSYPITGSPTGVTTLVGSKAAFDSKVTKTGNGYVLIDTGLKGCVMYDYTITPIVECRPDLVSDYTGALYSRVYGDGHDKGYPSIGPNSVSVPTDSAKPGDPVGLAGIPGDQKNYLSWTNPDDKDLKGVIIVRSTTGWPSAPTDGIVVFDDNTDGPGASCGIVDGKADTEARQTGVPLENGTCYYYTAFSYDKCGNYSLGVRSKNKNGDFAPDCSKPCGDGVEGSPEYGPPPPPPPSNFRMSICAQEYGVSKVNMGWSDANPLPDDCLGYNVYRSDQGSNPIRFYYKTPGSYNVYTDVDYPAEGNIYTYWVRTVDCANNLNVEDAEHPRVELTAYPGKVAYDSTVSTVIRGSYRNVVRFNTKNTSMKQAKISYMTLSWSGHNVESNAYLSEIWMGPSVTGTKIFSGSVPTGVVAPLSTPIFLPEATDSTHPSSTMFSFVFKTANGQETSAVDMTGTTLTIRYDYSLYYYNSYVHDYVETDQSLAACTPVTYTVLTPVGPTVNEVTQSQPLVGTFAETKTGMVVVPPDQLTDVSAYVTDTTDALVGMKSVKLFYAFTNRTTTAPPTVGSVPDGINRAVFTAMTTYPIGTGNYKQYKTSYSGSGHAIPAKNDKRIWYFILAEDNDSNFTRWPSPSTPDANFNYDELQSASGAGSVSTKIVSPAINSTVTGNLTVKIQATSTGGAGITLVQFKIDNGAWQYTVYNSVDAMWEAILDTSTLADGTHSITAQAVASGISGTATSSFSVQNSTVTCSIYRPRDGASLMGTNTIKVAASSSGSPLTAVRVNIDGGTWYDCTLNAGYYEYPWDTTTVTNGVHIINAMATNGSNTQYASVTVSVNNAKTVVNVNILAPLANATVSGTTTVVVYASSNGLGLSTVTLKVDNGSPQSCTLRMSGAYQGYWTYDLDTTGLAYGTHTLSITATDANGTFTTVTRNVFVDNTVITVNIIKPVSNATVSGTSALIQVYAATNGQAIAGVWYKIGSGSWISLTYNSANSFYEGTWNTTTYPNGQYTLTAMAQTTGATHTGTSQTVSVTVNNVADTTPPTVTVNHMNYGSPSTQVGPPVPTSQSIAKGTSVTWYISASDTSGVSNVYVNYNEAGSADIDITSSLSNGYYSYTATLPNGVGKSCVFKFRAKDNNNNMSSYTGNYTITTN